MMQNNLFILYMLPLAQIMEHHEISYHTYADDTQLYISVSYFCPKNERSKISPYLGSMSLTTTNQARSLDEIIDSDVNLNSYLKFFAESAYYHL